MDKGLVFDIRRYSVHDGPGIRSTVFFKGCPLNCDWCHNPESKLPKPQQIIRSRQLNGNKKLHEETIGSWMTRSEIMDVVMKDTMFYEESNGGVTFSGGEPMMQHNFLRQILIDLANEDIHTAVDTSGFVKKEAFNEIASNTNMLLFDIKSADSDVHKKYTGVPNKLIIENLLSLKEDGPELIIRIPIIPGVNSEISDIKKILTIILAVKAPVKRIDLLPYHLLGRQKYEALKMDTPRQFGPAMKNSQMKEIEEIFISNGYNTKIGG